MPLEFGKRDNDVGLNDKFYACFSRISSYTSCSLDFPKFFSMPFFFLLLFSIFIITYYHFHSMRLPWTLALNDLWLIATWDWMWRWNIMFTSCYSKLQMLSIIINTLKKPSVSPNLLQNRISRPFMDSTSNGINIDVDNAVFVIVVVLLLTKSIWREPQTTCHKNSNELNDISERFHRTKGDRKPKKKTKLKCPRHNSNKQTAIARPRQNNNEKYKYFCHFRLWHSLFRYFIQHLTLFRISCFVFCVFLFGRFVYCSAIHSR